MKNDRKMKILQAIIHSYITNGEPVGSRTISKKYSLGISPATIRNEMSDLEELGYLFQPYTSAGRIPSDKAYRLYVDSLIEFKNIENVKKQNIKKNLLNSISEIEQLVQSSLNILSDLTRYTTLAVAPNLKASKLKHIQLVLLDEYRILVVFVTSTGIVKNTIIRLSHSANEEQLSIITNLLNTKLKNKNIGDLPIIINREVINTIVKEVNDLHNIVSDIIPTLYNTIDELDNIKYYTDGVNKIFDYAEYNDICKAKEIISFLEDKETITEMLLRDNKNDIEVIIGNENEYDEIKNCSLITATYKMNGMTIGKIGLIGPTRMEYSKVIPIVKLMARDLNDILSKYFLD
ncbi:heat-inducible transcriptional repressor HrcA [Abyssisolibacter fermentans]|uniref:heat-inducible transcriptional repressor HrcA n=1 Tax=Abyssisolibacter fermentans TaxID=1766203 RepID=UPI000835E2A1|nr:heat-inducible transcriptional repressor HrcA [Abyssisolibacter fermentans]